MSEDINNPIASVEDDGTIKLDLRKDAVQEQSTDEVPVRDEPAVSEEVQPGNVEEAAEEPAQQEEPVQSEQPTEEVEEPQESALQEITDEEVEEAAVELEHPKSS